MSAIPPVSTSALKALQSGFQRLNKAAQEMTAPPADPQDPGSMDTTAADPMLAGVEDLLTARVQVRVGTVLLREYNRDMGRLFDIFA